MSKRLSSTAPAVDGTEEDPVVGEHAVHVEPQQADALAPAPGSIMRAGPRGRGSARTSASSRSSGHCVSASLSARAGSGMGLEEEPVRAGRRRGARAAAGMCSRWPPLAPPAPCPGCCTECVASNTTGAPWPRAAARNCACRRPGRRSRRTCRARSPRRRRLPADPRTFSTAPAIASACIHCPFFTFTGCRCGRRPRADRSGGRGRRESGARPPPPPRAAACARLVDIGQHRQAARGPHPLEHPESLVQAGSAGGAAERARLALSKLALKQTGSPSASASRASASATRGRTSPGSTTQGPAMRNGFRANDQPISWRPGPCARSDRNGRPASSLMWGRARMCPLARVVSWINPSSPARVRGLGCHRHTPPNSRGYAVSSELTDT